MFVQDVSIRVTSLSNHYCKCLLVRNGWLCYHTRLISASTAPCAMILKTRLPSHVTNARHTGHDTSQAQRAGIRSHAIRFALSVFRLLGGTVFSPQIGLLSLYRRTSLHFSFVFKQSELVHLCFRFELHRHVSISRARKRAGGGQRTSGGEEEIWQVPGTSV